MEKKVASVSSLSKGSLMIIEGEACKITDVKVSRPGKHGHAKCNITAIGMVDNKKRNIVLPGHDNVEVPLIDKRTGQILSITGKKANVMDSETFETFDLDIPEELENDVAEGCSILYWTILGAKMMKQIKTE